MTLSEDFIVAVLLCFAGIVMAVAAIIFLYKQKAYYNSDGHIVEIEVPLLGKLRTNIPAIAICFVGLVFAYLGYKLMMDRGISTVNFTGEVVIDKNSIENGGTVVIGMTSGALQQTRTYDSNTSRLKAEFSVPDSWTTYSGYAFEISGKNIKPKIIGTNLDEKRFKLEMSK